MDNVWPDQLFTLAKVHSAVVGVIERFELNEKIKFENFSPSQQVTNIFVILLK